MKATVSNVIALVPRVLNRSLRLISRGLGAVAALLAGVLLCATTRAADIVWTNAVSGNWNVAANWSPNQVPSTNDIAWITNNGTYAVTLDAAATITSLMLGGTSGTQSFTNAGSTLTLNGAGSGTTHGVFTFSSGTLNGNGSLTLVGLFNWSGGILGGVGSTLLVTANGGLAISGSTKTFSGGTLVNGGAGTWSAGQITCNNTALFSNAPSATFDLQADGSSFVTGSGSPSLANAGTLRKTAGTGTTTIAVPCNNSGSVQVNSGTLALTLAGGTGSFTASANNTLSVNGTATLSGAASIGGAGNFTVTSGPITNNGTFSVQGTNTFTSGTFSQSGSCLVTNGTVIVNGGIVVFNGSGTLAPAAVNLSSGSLLGNMTLSASGSSTWSGGILGSSGSTLIVAANGGLTLSGSTKTFNGGTLVNGGSGTWSAGQITCNNTALFSNAPSATFDLQADATSFALGSGSPSLANAGTLRKTAGTGTSTISIPCNNSGGVQVNSGTLALTLGNSGGSFTASGLNTLSVSGTATLSSGASIDGAGNFTVAGSGTITITNNGSFSAQGTNTFTSGTFSQNGNCAVSGGALIVNGGIVVFNGSGTLAPASVNLSSGSLLGNMTVNASGSSTWSGGTLGSAGSSLLLLANGGVAMSGSTKTFSGGTLVNGGSGTWTAGQITCNNTASFSNALGATFDLQADGNSFALGSGSPQLANAGALLKTAGAGTATINVPCNNSGSVQANSGTLALTLAGGTGSFAASANNTLSVNGSATLSGAASIGGAGNFTVTTGTITNIGAFSVQGTNTFTGGTFSQNGSCLVNNGAVIVNGGVSVFSGSGTLAPASVNLSSGSLLGNMTFTVIGPLVWTGGTLGSPSPSLLVLANGGLTLSGSTKTFGGGMLVNNGSGIWSAGQITCNNTATFSNAPGATFDLQTDTISFALGSGSPSLANAGTLRKTAGAGTTTISLPCNNSGSILANTGTLNFGAAFIQNGGQTVLNGGSFTFAQAAQLRGGTLSGAGTVTGSVSNNATVSPGASPGLLSITGNYTEGANAHLAIELGGTTPGTGHDQLSVSGSAVLAGSLALSYWNGFTPSPGNVFTVLVCNARSGGFSAITAPTNNLGTIYTSKAVLVEPDNASPTAQLAVNPVQCACRSFLVSFSGTDPDGTVTNMTLLLDTNVLVSLAGASAQTTVSYDFPGTITLTALATDNKGASGATNVLLTIGTLPLRTLDAIGFQTNHAFKLCMLGEAGTNYQILASNDVSSNNWPVLGTMQNTNGIWRYTDATATNSTHRYYRAHALP